MRDLQQLSATSCMRSKVRLCRHRVVTDQLPSVADFLVAVSFVSTQGRHTPALTGYFTNPCRSNAGLGQESRWLLLSSSGMSKDTILYSKLVSMKSVAVFLCLFSGVALPRRVGLGSIQIGRVSSIFGARHFAPRPFAPAHKRCFTPDSMRHFATCSTYVCM